VQAVLQGATGLPEDRFVNTFHFEWIGAGETFLTQAPVLTGAVEAFYLVAASNGRSLSQLMSPWITSITTSAYDLSLPVGEREPQTITLAWPDSSVTTNMPEEVACCLTIHGDPPVTPRRRGRLFIGPLVSNADTMVSASNTSPTRVNITTNQSLGNTLILKGNELINDARFNWVIRSVTPAENFVNVTGLWVDNAFDIIRKRGPDPDARRTTPV